MKKYLSFLIITLFVLGSIFAQDTKISANGVTVPNWMVNCAILESETGWGTQKTIGQILGKPNEATKLKKVVVDGNNLHLEYYVGEKPSEAVLELIMDFVCARLGDTGTAYCSHVKFVSRLTFEVAEVSCDGPKNAYKFGQCLGMLHASVELMFIDEEKVAREKALEEERKKEEEKRLAKEKRMAYWRQLETAVQEKEVSLGFSLDSIEYKQSYLGVDTSRIVVKNLDETMKAYGFQKGDKITKVDGLDFFVEESRIADLIAMVYDKDTLQCVSLKSWDKEVVEAEKAEVVFTLERKGKEMTIKTPALNPEQLKSFNEKFETDWEASHQKK
ncbi:MAG: hypothetical protein SOX64_11215 [Treponema sp.]|nr:hypothetical protein [Spirochaetia bacterium]MDY4211976.1 hypothetical protein [Treponema sp.]